MVETQRIPQSILREKEGLGIWEHRGKVAIAGVGHSPTDRRWEGDLDKSLGAYAKIAVQRALDDAGITVDDVDGIVSSPQGMGALWKPREYFDPPYDSEDGLSGVSAEWVINQMGLKNVQYALSGGDINPLMASAAQSVGDGKAKTMLVVRGVGNMPGRYAQKKANTVSGAAQWTDPWGFWGMAQEGVSLNQYCDRYDKSRDGMLPLALNSHRNGLMFPEGYYAQHQPTPFTAEEYLNSPWINEPIRMHDCDMPIQAVAAYVITTADLARQMKQKPVYFLNHCFQGGNIRSNAQTLEECEGACDQLVRKLLGGAGVSVDQVDVFNPYDGFITMVQFYLEAFHWHGVQRGEAYDFYADDIRVEGPHPLLSSGGNLGNGRTRYWHWTDSIQQLQGRAGERQIRHRAETAVVGMGGVMGAAGSWAVLSTSPD
jgi:hypothetical protein